jgi:hypothetical protein
MRAPHGAVIAPLGFRWAGNLPERSALALAELDPSVIGNVADSVATLIRQLYGRLVH